jgi:hypothetical protein
MLTPVIFAFLFYSAPAQRHRSGKDSIPDRFSEKANPFIPVNIKTKKTAGCYTFVKYLIQAQPRISPEIPGLSAERQPLTSPNHMTLIRSLLRQPGNIFSEMS